MRKESAKVFLVAGVSEHVLSQALRFHLSLLLAVIGGEVGEAKVSVARIEPVSGFRRGSAVRLRLARLLVGGGCLRLGYLLQKKFLEPLHHALAFAPALGVILTYLALLGAEQ